MEHHSWEQRNIIQCPVMCKGAADQLSLAGRLPSAFDVHPCLLLSFVLQPCSRRSKAWRVFSVCPVGGPGMSWQVLQQQPPGPTCRPCPNLCCQLRVRTTNERYGSAAVDSILLPGQLLTARWPSGGIKYACCQGWSGKVSKGPGKSDSGLGGLGPNLGAWLPGW